MKKLLLPVLLLLLQCTLFAQKTAHTFTLSDTAFLLDGKPFQIIAGEIHYPRVPREAWRQRMQMAKAMGINTIGTYVFWNVNEPEKDVFDFTGNADIAAFVKTAQEEGLWVVLRPSPYVCAEWEFGGYPYWLQNEGMQVRSKDPAYLAEYKKYIDELGKQLAPYLIVNGGNILMVQVENEYGSYGSDKAYLEINKKMFIDAGFKGLLYTCDPPNDMAKGRLPGLLAAVNAVNKPDVLKSWIKQNNDGKGPFFVAEWYPAWFDWWGEAHHTVPAARYAAELDELLGAGFSMSMYMFHGGTTRGFMNGANCYDSSYYQPQISSYDYDAPLDEAGNATDKFMQFRAVIQKHVNYTLPDVPAAKKSIAIPAIKFTSSADVFSILPKPVTAQQPLSFEKLNQAYGYVVYRTKIKNAASGMLAVKELRDYGVVFVNGKKQGVLNRMLKQDSLQIELSQGENTIDILVENMGRINFGPNLLKNNKGITEKVTLNGKELRGWQMYSLPMKDISSIKYNNKPLTGAPVLKKASFTLAEVGDTYLDMRKFGKGCVWVNGHNLGRYWQAGPQQTMYVPAEWLKKGSNEIIVFEMIKPNVNEISALDQPILNDLDETYNKQLLSK
ncbi:glycoside hydrolase family 35 protein [Parafilimonas sp.]|uniref:glycoside hydrolase family 35 protein n=1 Tax=Parafilimonas sp. TaxID=1969739 RepID=UPI0039E41FA4